MKSFEEIRFSGDRVEEYVNAGGSTPSPRERKDFLAKHHDEGLEVSPQLLPRLSAIFEDVKEKLGIGSGVHCFVIPHPIPNATCRHTGDSLESGEDSLVAIVLHSSLVNLMTDDELGGVIGHELGHAIFSHNKLPCPGPDQHPFEMMNAMRLSRAAEISADRIGFLCCPDIETCFLAELKLESGLSEEHLRIDIPAYLDQIRENREVLKHSGEFMSTHPMPALRLKALNLFSMSQAYYDWAGISRAGIATDSIDSVIEKDFEAICGMRREELYSDVISRMRMWGALRLFIVDDRMSRSEQTALKQFFGEEKAASAINFLKGKTDVVGTVEARLSEIIGEARALPEDRRDALVSDLEKFAVATGGGNTKVAGTLKDIARKLGINRTVRIPGEEPEE